VAVITIYSAPDDGRKGRPNHVEHTFVVKIHNTATGASCCFIMYCIIGKRYCVSIFVLIR